MRLTTILSRALIATLLAGAPAASAQPWTPVGSEFQVNSSTTGQQWHTKVASDPQGNFVVVWDGEGQGDDEGILGQRFRSDGLPLGPEFWVNIVTYGSQSGPSVGRADDGEFVVVWDDSYFGEQDVWAQRFSSSGTFLGANFRINATVDPDQRRSDLAVLPDGRFIVAWTAAQEDLPRAGGGEGGDPGNAEVIARRFAADGSPLGAEFQVNTYTTLQQTDAAIAATGDGRFIVGWSSRGQDGDLDGVYAQRFASGGGKLGGEFQVNTYTTNFQYGPSIALTEDDGFVVTWTSTGQDGSNRSVFGQRFNSNGSRAGDEFAVNSYTTFIQDSPAVLASSSGGFFVAWEGYEIQARLYGANGSPASGEHTVNSYQTSLQSNPAVSGDAGGQFVVTWSSFDQDGDVQGVFGRRFIGPLFADSFESGDTSAWSSP